MSRQRTVAVLWVAAGVPLAVGAVAGLALSFGNIGDVVRPIVGARLAPVFPLVWDVVLFGAAVAYLATAHSGVPRPMWRAISQGGVVGTIAVNAVAAHDVRTLVVHVSGPVAWAVLVEAGAAQLRGDHRDQVASGAIPLRLWVWSPRESAATWLRMARRLDGEQATARLEAGLHAAAVEALKQAVPGRAGRQVRAIITRQLRAGSLTPHTVLAACGWLDQAPAPRTPQGVLRAALGATGGPAGAEPPVAVEVVQPEGQPHLALGPGETPDTGDGHDQGSDPAGKEPDPDGPADGSPDTGDEDPVLVAAREVAADLAGRGRRVTRQSLLDGMRDRRVPVSTARGSRILRQLRDAGTA